MANQHVITDGNSFRTDQGGCRPPTHNEENKIPRLPQHVLDKLAERDAARNAAKSDPNTVPMDVKGSFVAQYNAAYWDENQGGTGCCTACAADVLTMAAALFLQGIKIPQPSWGFGYYAVTAAWGPLHSAPSYPDPTFKRGFSVSGAVSTRAAATGCCTDSLYPQSYVLTEFNKWPGGAFNASQLPQPPCYEDGKTRKILQYYRVFNELPNLDLVRSLLRAGHPIGFALGNHAMCLIDVSTDGYWFFAKDSVMANIDNGNGRGIRTLSATAMASSFDLVTVTLVETGTLDAPPAPQPIPPPPLPSSEVAWSDDAIPSGAIANKTPNTINEPWLWVTINPAPMSKTKAHQSEIRMGVHQHYWSDAPPFAIGANDKLFAYVYLDVANPPQQIVLMWYGEGSWKHAAYWGANYIPDAVYVGPLPGVGIWTRLEVPAATVGLAGKSVIGMSFKLYDGRVTWDRCGKLTP